MYFNRRLYIAITVVILTFVAANFVPWLVDVAFGMLIAFVAAVVADIALLYCRRAPLTATRSCADRFSNGDDNEVLIKITGTYPFAVNLEVVDEIPYVFQRRDVSFKLELEPDSEGEVRYTLRPTRRGVYGFGLIRVFITTLLGLVSRRVSQGEARDIKVYPSYLMLNKYELLAMSNNLTELGIKRIRRVGNNTEFEQIKEYVTGDEYRSINWKASARRAQLMVNVYQDERSQQVFNVIDTGRVMQQAFENMTLLDYAINASLVLSYVATHRQDKAGIVTFAGEFGDYVPANKQGAHMMTINEALYGLDASSDDSDYASLVLNVDRLIRKRSLLVLYTNFTSIDSMRRQLPYLRRLNNRHRLLVVFFADVEMMRLVDDRPLDTRGYYTHVIARRHIASVSAIVGELRQNGIYALFTPPASLSINVINKYLEFKARHLF